MKFMKSELEMIYQYAAPSKAETLDGMKETLPFIKDDLTRAIMENAICKLEKVPEPECSKLIAENKAQFMEKRDNSILLRLALAKANQSVLLGHDLMGTERFMPETKHMITLDVLNSDSPVGFPGERYRFFLMRATGMQSAASSVGKFRLKAIPTWKPERSILTKTSQTGNGKFDRGEQQAIIPYGVGRNYTPVKPVRCVLLKAPCREQNDFRRFSVCPNHYRGRYTSPALSAASYPFCGLAI